MAKPTLVSLNSGQQGWDSTVNDNFDKLSDAALPVFSVANEGALPTASDYDECLVFTQDTKTLWYSNGAAWAPLLEPGTSDLHGAYTRTVVKAELMDASVSLTSTVQFPAGCRRKGLVARVVSELTTGDGATDFDLGDGTDVDLYAAAKALTAGTTVDGTDRTAAVQGEVNAAENVVITPNSGTLSGGTLRIVLFYELDQAPTS